MTVFFFFQPFHCIVILLSLAPTVSDEKLAINLIHMCMMRRFSLAALDSPFLFLLLAVWLQCVWCGLIKFILLSLLSFLGFVGLCLSSNLGHYGHYFLKYYLTISLSPLSGIPTFFLFSKILVNYSNETGRKSRTRISICDWLWTIIWDESLPSGQPGTPICILVCLMESHRSLRICSLFFILFLSVPQTQ